MVAAPESQFKTMAERAEQADQQREVDEYSQVPAQLNDDDEAHPVERIESLCTECMEQGETRLMLTTIPYFREVVILSFRCEHCGNQNAEVQPASRIQERGSVYTVKVTDREDLNRQLVRSEYCTVTVPEFELTIPARKGQLTTIEGIIEATVRDLAMDQDERMHQSAELYDKIEALLAKLRPVLDDQQPMPAFTVKLDDPSGNSFAEPHGAHGLSDPKWSKREYQRTRDDEVALGLQEATPAAATLTDDYEGERPEEVHSFPSQCTSCLATLETLMKTVTIPHFKDVILMSANCHACGYRDTEIKTGGAVSEFGRRITLQVEDEEDLKRDILKSDTCGLEIPEIELDLAPGTLGGRFTTLEGILSQIYDELDERVFARGDSAVVGKRDAMEDFLAKLKAAMAVEMPFSVILDDPMGNSYIQNPYAPDADPKMQEDTYERTFEQNEELGLNDIKVEGYEGEAEAKAAYLAELAAERERERLASLRVRADTPDR